MKYIQKIVLITSLLSLFLTSCSDWTKEELEEIDHIGGNNNMLNIEESAAFFKDLRDWKAMAENYGRPVSFGWFSNWAPAGAVRKGYLSTLPDSIDIVSMWSGPFNMNEAKKNDKAYIQKVKGTKVLVCYILHNIGTGINPPHIAENIKKENSGLSEAEINKKITKAHEEYWGFKSGIRGTDDHTEAIRKYARVLVDSIVKNDYDGLDIDWEPSGAGDGDGNLKNDYHDAGKYLHILVEELGKYLGPKATINTGKRRYLLVDGELWNVSKESVPYFDYYVSQAYGDRHLEGRVTETQNYYQEYYDTRKHIFTENFESYSQSGGALLDQAIFNSKKGAKGGVGSYRMDNDYDNKPDYKWTRKAIYLMHKSYDEYMKK
ncbi:glycoside hydrolase family 18 [Capnocytophaga catalasegens]|uniref:Glycoside hydrolase family 18 n=1 Tax=Capnocytophaga catalasegens TaxID=1004260 RepID=A0AAV5AUY7_9FLAO|nr:glycoside hydrolase family 18 [Capnocytophaga catalasegens]GIZ16004.1 hypothetical protein RCZ03_20040 [Capnocytophaga catalasegens]GJM50419.1 hypothetical protein RCZ15_13920 [Capnocytophaga catalasegens]GJM51807.1 hypothetical protein RCZ16_01250 [Capnocytophaga catalasegens]